MASRAALCILVLAGACLSVGDAFDWKAFVRSRNPGSMRRQSAMYAPTTCRSIEMPVSTGLCEGRLPFRGCMNDLVEGMMVLAGAGFNTLKSQDCLNEFTPTCTQLGGTVASNTCSNGGNFCALLRATLARGSTCSVDSDCEQPADEGNDLNEVPPCCDSLKTLMGVLCTGTDQARVDATFNPSVSANSSPFGSVQADADASGPICSNDANCVKVVEDGWSGAGSLTASVVLSVGASLAAVLLSA